MIFLRVPKKMNLRSDDLRAEKRGPGFSYPEGPRGPHNAAWVQVYLGAYAVGVLAAGRLALMSMQRGSIDAYETESAKQ